MHRMVVVAESCSQPFELDTEMLLSKKRLRSDEDDERLVEPAELKRSRIPESSNSLLSEFKYLIDFFDDDDIDVEKEGKVEEERLQSFMKFLEGDILSFPQEEDASESIAINSEDGILDRNENEYIFFSEDCLPEPSGVASQEEKEQNLVLRDDDAYVYSSIPLWYSPNTPLDDCSRCLQHDFVL